MLKLYVIPLGFYHMIWVGTLGLSHFERFDFGAWNCSRKQLSLSVIVVIKFCISFRKVS